MRRTIDFKFICLSLLMAGAGMIVTACSNEDEDSVKQETRDGSEASNAGIVTDAVVLDADTLIFLHLCRVFDTNNVLLTN